MEPGEERKYRGLSPFELKNKLIELARHRGERMMLNAGRGNPNWIAIDPRAACFLLGQFALQESQTTALAPGLGGLPKKRGIADRLRAYCAGLDHPQGSRLLLRGIDFAVGTLGLDADLLVGEWVDGVLGDHYPVPVRMLTHAECIVRRHLAEVVYGGAAAAAGIDLFAVEGASAGIAYLFQSLVHSSLLSPGDRIALGTPIFTPYLDVPRLPEYGFGIVEVMQDENNDWRYPPTELDKLRDPSVKLFLAVNPSNPTAVAMDADTVARIAAIAAERPDLVIVTDDVYASFVDRFGSLAAAAPRNTILIYSFSKFWGATGLRLGVVALHASNHLDERLLSMPPALQFRARARYSTIATQPERTKFIDRMVADSRAVGLNHTAGLSTLQQVQMSLFALDGLLDTEGERRRLVLEVVGSRYRALYRGVGLSAPGASRFTHYYATLDIPRLARDRYGAAFADWMVSTFEPIDFVVQLAERYGVVLLDGGGFDAPKMSVRVSLANLPDESYERIGHAVSSLLDDYRARYLQRG